MNSREMDKYLKTYHDSTTNLQYFQQTNKLIQK